MRGNLALKFIFTLLLFDFLEAAEAERQRRLAFGNAAEHVGVASQGLERNSGGNDAVFFSPHFFHSAVAVGADVGEELGGHIYLLRTVDGTQSRVREK